MSSPHHIIICTDAWHDQVNGVVRTLEYLQNELQDMGHRVTIIGPKDFAFTLPMPRYREIKLALLAAFEIVSKLNAFDFNKHNTHLHIATEGPIGVAARRYAVKNSISFTTTYHTEFPDYLKKRAPYFMADFVFACAQRYVRNFHALAQTMFVATESLENKLRAQGFTNSITRFTRGADVKLFRPHESDVLSHLPKPIALYVGRVAVEKNLEAFLSASWHGTKVIVGDGPSRSDLETRFPDAIFVGAKFGDDLAAYYAGSDVFAFPSLTDTFGMVIIEALACGLPVAGFPVTGPKDILTEPFLGAMDDEFSTALHMALNTSGTAQDRHDYIVKHYNWRDAAQQFLSATLKPLAHDA